jgi:dihydrofolate reductase
MLKATPGGDSLVIGSGELVQTLTRNDLVDEYRLWWHPVVLAAADGCFPKAARTQRCSRLR